MSAHRFAPWRRVTIFAGAIVCGFLLWDGGQAQAQPYGPYWYGPYRGYHPRFYARPFPGYFGYGYQVGPAFGFGPGPWYGGPWYGGGWYGNHGPDWHVHGGYQ